MHQTSVVNNWSTIGSRRDLLQLNFNFSLSISLSNLLHIQKLQLPFVFFFISQVHLVDQIRRRVRANICYKTFFRILVHERCLCCIDTPLSSSLGERKCQFGSQTIFRPTPLATRHTTETRNSIFRAIKKKKEKRKKSATVKCDQR